MEKVIRKFKSFEEAEKAEIEYWRNASTDERVNSLLQLQELMVQLFYPDAKGMEKVIRIKKIKTGKKNP